jgi:hypothetical protein
LSGVLTLIVARHYQLQDFAEERRAAMAAWAAHVLAVAAVDDEPAAEDDAEPRRPV